MKITIVGAGNVGTVLGRRLKEKGHAINEIYSRNHSHAVALSDELQARVCHDLKQINKQSDLYIVAVSDDALGRISASLQLDKQIILHTSGSISIGYLRNVSENYGVLYPVQSLRKETHDIPSMPFLVDGNNKDTLQQITNLAISISPQVIVANDETRFHYHLTAVI
ncbi:MAG TPA: NAD(P)-binding domain-containing protein, partial [Parafilimonas sp.]|nr:NAD(P)-binding domain-containing protein [Parafilimonas sp.]